ncbi:MAG: hypothetical protein EOO33_14610 [Comamonadaceae bacterium]|nr:MAG: hypothetical protein EOO33_14610 [Comamonadaceae bacterium]
MSLTVEILEMLDAHNVGAATHTVRSCSEPVALIELLEMLWSSGIDGAGDVIGAVLERLQQLRSAR